MVNHALLKDRPFNKPIVAAVNGDCVAGGLELLLSTDVRAAAPHARFGLPEVRWSIYPFGGATVKLTQQIGYVHAMDLLLTGRLVDAAFAADPMIPAEQISGAVHDGIIDLSGEVSRGAERVAAEEVVLDLLGVVDVHNRIAVADLPVQVDEIEATIREAFTTEAAAAAAKIAAQVNGGRVTLTGTTPTPHYRLLAERVAWKVMGVSEVRNEIQVGR
jgi:enoyl-CoA hydratase/carnithine racemase